MKDSLKPGIRYEHKFRVPPSKTVPALYPESEEFVAMPEVFATGFLVGFLEWVNRPGFARHHGALNLRQPGRCHERQALHG